LRPILGAALTLLAALGTTAAGAATANAASADTFSVVSAGASSGNPDQLTVVVDSPSTITGLAASLSPLPAGASAYAPTLTLSSSETDPSDATQTQTTWTASIPAGTSPNGLPLGTYSIDLTATYSDGTSSALTHAGTYGFYLTEAVTLQASNSNVAYPNIWITLSGQVTLTYPDGTADTNSADYTGSVLTFDQTAGQPEGSFGNVPVKGDGTFTVSAFWPQWTQTYVVQVESDIDAKNYIAQSSPVTLTVTTVTPTLTLTSRPTTVTDGKAAVVTGTLTYPTGTTQAPAAGQQVWISTDPGNSGGHGRSTTTDAKGDFSLRLPYVASATKLYVGTYNLDLLNAVQVPFTVDVVHPTTVKSLSVKLDQFWDLSVKGCMSFLSGDTAQSFTSTAGLELQYQVPYGRSWSAWKNLAAIPSNEKTSRCGVGGTWFTDTLYGRAPANYAHYRVIYRGTKGATSYAPSASAVVLTWRYADRITNYKVSEKTVSGKHVLTFTGVLQYYANGKWNDYSGQDLELNVEYKNKWYYWTKMIKTGSTGQFSYKLDAPWTATWNMEFLGNNSSPVGHLAYETPNVTIKV
jgi:hypothetical protein